ncbi:hypothetical protein FN846DRAFT_903986 [Sphaerosporella brunnea]|uniref:non-specific serine/threonine protein kinase n=1 Tax=Sphaerosporella brunnea TaxID=1250544 RepID=A0A5J5F6P8_9PEZI|nr:hypothetical protein FN846DRAFT_903986 [Sphaerosporella brunnea]
MAITRSMDRRREASPPAPHRSAQPAPSMVPQRTLTQPQHTNNAAQSSSALTLAQSLQYLSINKGTEQSTPRGITSDSFRPHGFNDTDNRPGPSNTTQAILDLSLYNELWGKIVYDDASLWAMFDRRTSVQVPESLHNGSSWVNWPQESTREGAVLRWFFNDIAPLVLSVGSNHTMEYVASGNLILQGGDAKRKTDLLLRCAAPNSTLGTYWDQVRVVGELKSNRDKDGRDKTLIQLANYVRELFSTQPQRCWALAFTLCGSVMRVYRFDRSGAVVSTPIDIHKEPLMFVQAMAGFVAMDASAIGFDPSIRWDRVTDSGDTIYDPTISFVERHQPDPFIWAGANKYRIDPSFIVRRYAIATRGTVCWRARPYDAPADSPWQYVVKDQWRAVERSVEGDFLSVIAPGTPGLPEYIWHTDIRVAGHTMDVAGGVRGGLVHGTDRTPTTHSGLTMTSKNLYRTAPDIRLKNRIKTRLIMSPVGVPLLSFTSYKHLLLALIDAIRGHQHMYRSHKIVHRDVSLNNILLYPDPGPPYGFLIDFDFAVSRTRMELSGAEFITGTFKYMSIDVLSGCLRVPHGPQHDLESFYYVLLDIAIYYNGRGRRRVPLPPHTVFVDPVEENAPSLAAGAKSLYLDPNQFDMTVLPTIAPEAHCIVDVLDQWRALIAGWKLRVRPRGVRLGPGIMDEDSVVDGMYKDVLEVLQIGVEALG